MCGVRSGTDEEVLSSFYNFIDAFEADALTKYVSHGKDNTLNK